MNVLRNTEQTIIEEKLLEHGDKVLAAVSGGPDSVALLHILHQFSEQWGLQIVVAHVNHQFRGEESDREAETVGEIAKRLDLPCEIAVINLPEYIRRNAVNAQDAAREKRYEFLLEAARKHNAGKIALAHHADDQAETVLMRLIRGTGPSGLCGIPVRRDLNGTEIIRPFIRIYKEEIIRYCHGHHLEYCKDSSNDSRKYFRNQIRLDVLPFLLRYNEQLPLSLNRLAQLACDEDDYLAGEAKRLFNEMVDCNPDGCFFSRKDFLTLHVALQRRLIKLILYYLSPHTPSWDYLKIETVRSSVSYEPSGNMSFDVSAGIRFRKEYDNIGLIQKKECSSTADYTYVLDAIPDTLDAADLGFVMTFKILEFGEVNLAALHPEPNEALFDLDKLMLPVTIRNRKDGDRIELLGMEGSKKLKDLFIDLKIPASRRNKIPVLTDSNGNILWIAGVRRSRHALVSERTRRFLYIKCLARM
jgi:tRNA(Ile)-lysidine synthase